MGKPSPALRELGAAHQALLEVARCQAAALTTERARLSESRKEISELAALNESQSQDLKALSREVEMLRAERQGVVLRQVGENVMVVRR